MSRSAIPEHLLHALWRDAGRFLSADPRLTDGNPVRILDGGEWNAHRGGPDFLNARIAIDNVAVSGDIEIHVTPEDWSHHHHDGDARYSNVVLHVVLEYSEQAGGASPNIPTLALSENLDYDRRELWQELFHHMYDTTPELPCFPHNLQVPMRFKRKVIEKFGEARLEELVDRVSLLNTDPDPERGLLERVYQLTMDALGYSQNRTPFRELSSLLPISRLRWVRDAFADDPRTAFEALFFGVAGLLPLPSLEFDAPTNEYIIDLRSRWNVIEATMRFPEVLAESDWAFFRIRPMNSPYRRLALAAQLAEKYFSDPEWSFASEFFADGPQLPVHPYWFSRTSFGQQLERSQSLLGEERAAALRLNVILPARIARARLDPTNAQQRHEAERTAKEWALARTESSAKYLRTIRQELLEGENVNSVRSEQGALTLQRNFCEKRRCLECPIGIRLHDKGWSPR